MTEPVELKDVSTKEREKLADKGAALPDGSYPIKTTGDLRNAISAVGRAGKKGSPGYERVRRHVIKRAKALDAVGSLPPDWGVTAAVELGDSEGHPFRGNQYSGGNATENDRMAVSKMFASDARALRSQINDLSPGDPVRFNVGAGTGAHFIGTVKEITDKGVSLRGATFQTNTVKATSDGGGLHNGEIELPFDRIRSMSTDGLLRSEEHPTDNSIGRPFKYASLSARVERLELAVVALARMELGDSPGHPFRGNQYGSPSTDSGPIERFFGRDERTQGLTNKAAASVYAAGRMYEREGRGTTQDGITEVTNLAHRLDANREDRDTFVQTPGDYVGRAANQAYDIAFSNAQRNGDAPMKHLEEIESIAHQRDANRS